MRHGTGLSTFVFVMAAAYGLSAADEATIVRTNDIEYARVDDQRLLLDLYMPKGVARPRLLVWIHGGAWRSGSRSKMPLTALVEHGWAVASVDYRLSPVASFPAQIHDIRASIRFLRANVDKYGYVADRIAIAGASAGGHLVALCGVTNGHKDLEGKVGEDLEHSSDVQAVVSFYGASNLTTILNQSTPHGLSVRVPALELLLGGQPETVPEIAKLASPMFHVDENDPPLLLFHGDQDAQMPINQSIELLGAYRRYDRPVEFKVVHGAGHGGPKFYDDRRLELTERFLNKHL